jgi:hypothetical protein
VRIPVTTWMALFEALEIHKIIEAFNGDSLPAMKTKLMRALCGRSRHR